MPKPKKYLCSRCGADFKTWASLRTHSKKHTDTLKEIAMLRRGQLPAESKIGMKFKGKNKVIIS